MSFDPTRSYSKTFAYQDFSDPVAEAHKHALKFLPSGAVYEVRSFDRRDASRVKGINNERNDHRAGWYYEPEMQVKDVRGTDPTHVRGDGRDGAFVGRYERGR